MILRRFAAMALSIPLTLGFAVALALPATAAELTITDPVRDNAEPGLDMVSGILANDDYVLSGTVGFRKDASGTLVVGLKAHERGMIRIISHHRAGGSGTARLIDRDGGRIACEGLAVSWNTAGASAAFSVPSSCLWKGNYGAVRPWYLIEGLRSGHDVDLASTRTFVARG